MSHTKGPFGDRKRFELKVVKRDFSCPEYENCLDIAHENGWRTFTCAGCQLAEVLFKIEVFGGDDNSRKHRRRKDFTT